MPPIAKKHLQFAAWPEEDRAWWIAAFEPGDVFDDDAAERIWPPQRKWDFARLTPGTWAFSLRMMPKDFACRSKTEWTSNRSRRLSNTSAKAAAIRPSQARFTSCDWLWA